MSCHPRCRTPPLITSLRRLAHPGAPPTLSRRRFLAKSLAAAAAAAFPLPLPADPAPKTKITIIGAGLSGLHCALTLLDHGLRPEIYEASGRPGGRVFSNNQGFWASQQITEWCGELIDSNHATMRALAQRFGLLLDDLVAAQPPNATETFHINGQYYPRAGAVKDFQPVLAALQADLKSAGDTTTFDSHSPAACALDNMSVSAWIEARVSGGLRSPLGQLLDVAFTAEFGAETSAQSALNLIYTLSGSDRDFQIYGLSDERFHIKGGNQKLTDAIAAHLAARNVPIQTGAALTAVRQTADGRCRLSFASSREVTADIVVLTLPFPVLRALDCSAAGFDARKLHAIQNLGAAKNAKLQLQFAQRLWNTPGPWGLSTGYTFSNAGCQTTWEATRAQPGPAGILNNYLGGPATDHLRAAAPFTRTPNPSLAVDAENFLHAIAPVFPKLPSLWQQKATLSLPHLSPLFKCSYSYWKTGQYQTIAGSERLRQKNILFAGEHTSLNFQGFMEGAAQEGRRAAQEILTQLGL